MTVRAEQESAWLLHHRPFRDSSRILDLLSREHGRISVVARGSRAAKSKLRGILRPFVPLSVSWVSRSDLGTLTGAEMGGAPLTLGGDTLMSGYYLNELLLKFLHRDDPQPDIFDAYSRAIAHLAAAAETAPVLRRFEMELLRLLGYALDLECDAEQRTRLEEEAWYEYRVEQGAVRVDRGSGAMVFSGRELRAIAAHAFSDPGTLRSAGRLLRGVIAFHLDGRELMSRKVLRELRAARDNDPTDTSTGSPQ